ncbi:MAG: glycosyltransferase family 2 protein [bacterium]|nr:glycosyltransferase family 2 protein [bacterium]
MRLSVIIPAYNEEQRLPGTLKAVDEYLRKQSYEYEVVVVNGGSKDRTADIVRESMSAMPYLRLVETENRGKGYAVQRGMLEAKGDIRLFTDADNSTSIDQVEKMFPWFDQGYGVVIGSRDVQGAILNPPQPWFRNLITAESFKLLRKILVGLWDIEDSQCGFKAFSAKATQAVFPKSVIERFAFDPEVLSLARKYGYKIKEIPVTWVNDIHSKVGIMSMVKMGIDLLRIRWNMITSKYGS